MVTRLGSIVALAAMLVVAVPAIARIPDPATGRIYGCYQKTTGALRVIDHPATSECPRGSKLIWWSQEGPTGRRGPEGPKGDTGPKGDAGSTPLFWRAAGSNHGDGVAALVTRIPCGLGYRAIGGGYQVSGPDRLRMVVVESRVDNLDDGRAVWEVVVESRDGQPASFTVEVDAYCMSDLPLGDD